tara:strand:+ start:2864 stop:3322 length:459 start_codon:yes stop_codon:yes gene_type:complete
MAFTPDQQYLIDTKSTDDPVMCCLSVGGAYSELTQTCQYPQFDNVEVPIADACAIALEIAEGEPSVGDQTGGGINFGGFGTWFGDNLEGLTDSFTTIWETFNPLTTPTLPPPDGTNPPLDEEDKSKKQIWLVVGLVLVLVLAVYLIRKRSKS